MSIKILFLDIDGVLNSSYGKHTKVPEHGCLGVETRLKTRFKKILKQTDVKIVLCSTWRLHDYLIEHLTSELEWEDRYSGKTDIWPWWGKEKCPYEDERQWEVEKWIDDHPEIEKWICLDDSVYPVNRPNGKKINVDTRFGLSEKQTKEIIQFFNGERNT